MVQEAFQDCSNAITASLTSHRQPQALPLESVSCRSLVLHPYVIGVPSLCCQGPRRCQFLGMCFRQPVNLNQLYDRDLHL